jgi:hypothetical protein
MRSLLVQPLRLAEILPAAQPRRARRARVPPRSNRGRSGLSARAIETPMVEAPPGYGCRIVTADAKREAVRDGAPPIELVDGEKLVELFEKLELGLTPRTTFDLNESFFEEFRR